MVRRKNGVAPSGRSILLVDDDPAYLESTRKRIERDGHEVIVASSGPEGLELLRTREVDLVLVDYLMPGMSGEEFVRTMREMHPTTQVVLQTGYANEHPPRKLMQRLDIQGYHDKSDGPAKLALWIDVGLKATSAIQLLTKKRAGLRYVLDATPALHRIQPIDDLVASVLAETAGLLRHMRSFRAPVAAEDETFGAFVALGAEDCDMRIRSATGHFRGCARLSDALAPDRLAEVRRALRDDAVGTLDDATVARLRVGGRTLGLVYLEQTVRSPWEAELVELLANQAAVAIHNVELYEMAALDALTGVATRRFFEQSLARELRSCSRTGVPVGLLVIDVDDMKSLNDELGHVAGDRALVALGTCIRQAVRTTDVVGRLGGDEFAVLLPGAGTEGVAVVAARLRAALAELTFEHDGKVVPVRASVGAAALDGMPAGESFRMAPEPVLAETTRRLVEAADAAMYHHKRGDGVAAVSAVAWVPAVAA